MSHPVTTFIYKFVGMSATAAAFLGKVAVCC